MISALQLIADGIAQVEEAVRESQDIRSPELRGEILECAKELTEALEALRRIVN